MPKLKSHGFGPPAHEIHGNVMLGICRKAQREGHFETKTRTFQSNSTIVHKVI